MLKFSQPEAVIFDMDGTLFKTESLLIPVYHQTFDTLKKEGLYAEPTPPESRLLESLGKLLSEIWDRVLPDADKQTRQRADELLLKYEIEGLRNGLGNLYPETKKTLRQLRDKGIRLFIASNGLDEYVKEILHAFHIYEWFEGIYTAGAYQTSSKVELVHILKHDHQLTKAWMVGDRSSDVEAGKENGFDVIGCNYAKFGQHRELAEADVIINSISELLLHLNANT